MFEPDTPAGASRMFEPDTSSAAWHSSSPTLQLRSQSSTAAFLHANDSSRWVAGSSYSLLEGLTTALLRRQPSLVALKCPGAAMQRHEEAVVQKRNQHTCDS